MGIQNVFTENPAPVVFSWKQKNTEKKKVQLFVAESSQLYETWKLGQSKEREKGPKREDGKAFFFFFKAAEVNFIFVCFHPLFNIMALKKKKKGERDAGVSKHKYSSFCFLLCKYSAAIHQ